VLGIYFYGHPIAPIVHILMRIAELYCQGIRMGGVKLSKFEVDLYFLRQP
jgi:hypothetical protein